MPGGGKGKLLVTARFADADDCDHLRHDPLIQTVAGCDPLGDDGLASQPSISRLENAADRRVLLRMGVPNFPGRYIHRLRWLSSCHSPGHPPHLSRQKLAFHPAVR